MKGTVNEEYHKTLAGETVANLPGVKSVDIKLEVKMEAPAEYSDVWLITNLLFHRNVSGMNTEYARDVEGV